MVADVGQEIVEDSADELFGGAVREVFDSLEGEGVFDSDRRAHQASRA